MNISYEKGERKEITCAIRVDGEWMCDLTEAEWKRIGKFMNWENKNY